MTPGAVPERVVVMGASAGGVEALPDHHLLVDPRAAAGRAGDEPRPAETTPSVCIVPE